MKQYTYWQPTENYKIIFMCSAMDILDADKQLFSATSIKADKRNDISVFLTPQNPKCICEDCKNFKKLLTRNHKKGHDGNCDFGDTENYPVTFEI